MRASEDSSDGVPELSDTRLSGVIRLRESVDCWAHPSSDPKDGKRKMLTHINYKRLIEAGKRCLAKTC